MKKFMTITLLTIKNIFLFLGCIVLATLMGCLAFLPFALLFHLTSTWFIGLIALGFIVWIAWGVATDEYKERTGDY